MDDMQRDKFIIKQKLKLFRSGRFNIYDEDKKNILFYAEFPRLGPGAGSEKPFVRVFKSEKKRIKVFNIMVRKGEGSFASLRNRLYDVVDVSSKSPIGSLKRKKSKGKLRHLQCWSIRDSSKNEIAEVNMVYDGSIIKFGKWIITTPDGREIGSITPNRGFSLGVYSNVDVSNDAEKILDRRLVLAMGIVFLKARLKRNRSN
jgi:hypothetical protein